MRPENHPLMLLTDQEFKNRLDFFRAKFQENLNRFDQMQWTAKDDIEDEKVNLRMLRNEFQAKCIDASRFFSLFQHVTANKDKTKPFIFTENETAALASRETALNAVEKELRFLVSILSDLVKRVMEKRSASFFACGPYVHPQQQSIKPMDLMPRKRKDQLLCQYGQLYMNIARDRDALHNGCNLHASPAYKSLFNVLSAELEKLSDLLDPSNQSGQSIEAFNDTLKSQLSVCVDSYRNYHEFVQKINQIVSHATEKLDAFRDQYEALLVEIAKKFPSTHENIVFKLFENKTEEIVDEVSIFSEIMSDTVKIISVTDFQKNLDEQFDVCEQLLRILDIHVNGLKQTFLDPNATNTDSDSDDSCSPHEENVSPPELTSSLLIEKPSDELPSYSPQRFYPAPPRPSYLKAVTPVNKDLDMLDL
ncbi:MAG: hypothetical protein NTZ67_02125 [Gammaproteobacteria bacterium]|nr:hypothetical protein [Gammaproteobacteria bacterium]